MNSFLSVSERKENVLYPHPLDLQLSKITGYQGYEKNSHNSK